MTYDNVESRFNMQKVVLLIFVQSTITMAGVTSLAVDYGNDNDDDENYEDKDAREHSHN